MFRLRDSIILRLWIPVVFLLLLLAIGVSIYYTGKQKAIITRNTNEILYRTGRTVALGVELSLRYEDFSGMPIAFDFVKTDSIFDFIAIIEEDSLVSGQQLLTSYPEKLSFNPLQPPQKLYTYTDIPFRSEMLHGVVRIGKLNERINEEIYKLNRPVYIAVIFLFILLITLLFFILRNVVRPLNKLAELIAKPVILPEELYLLQKKAVGEVKILTDNFTSLQERVRIEKSENDSLLQKLDALVYERTLDLENVRKSLLNAQRIASVGSFEYFSESDILCSETLAEMLGLPFQTDFESFLKLLHKDDAETVRFFVNNRSFFDKIIRFSVTNYGQTKWARLICQRNPNITNGAGFSATFQDITAQIEIEEELRKREEILSAIASATSSLITSSDYSTSILDAFAVMGQSVRADRVYVFQTYVNHETREITHSQRFEWNSGLKEPQINNPDLQNIPHDEAAQVFYGPLMKNIPFVGLVKDIENEKLHEMLFAQEIVSLLVLPVFVGDQFWGMVGFDDCHSERIWKAYEIDILKTFAATLGVAIVRNEAMVQVQRLSLVAEHTSNYVIITDEKKLIQWVNTSLLNATGYHLNDLVGKTPKIFQSAKTDKKTIARINEKLSRYEIVLNEEVFNVGKNGYEYWLNLNIVPIFNDKGICTGFIAVETDITQRMKIEDSLRNLNQDLERRVVENTRKYLEVNKAFNEQEKLAAIGEVAAGIAHDLNTPISTVMIGAETLLEKIKLLLDCIYNLSKTDLLLCLDIAQRFEREIFVSGTQLEREKKDIISIIESPNLKDNKSIAEISTLLVQCRILDKKVILQLLDYPNVINILMVIDVLQTINNIGSTLVHTSQKSAAVVKNLRDFIRKKDLGIRLKTNLYKSINSALNIFNYNLGTHIKVETRIDNQIFILGYEIQLLQLWTNLFKNAIEALVNTKNPIIKVYTSTEPGFVTIHFENNGPQIPKELLQKMFTRFFTTKGEQSGTGLGLTIVKNVVRDHGGGIDITSDEQATVFAIKLPTIDINDNL